ncbi:MAG: MerC domain-containing protein [Pseudomonadota bacterium]
MDRIGIVISALCLVHCLLTPALILMFPVISVVGAYDAWIHLGLAVLIFPVAYQAINQGYKHHKNNLVLILAVLGLSLFALSTGIAFFAEHNHHQLGGHDHDHGGFRLADSELLISVFGSLMVSAAHGLNLWLCRDKSIS